VTHAEKILELLSDGQPHSHHELYALGCVAHSRVSDLRAKGYAIDCWREGDLSMYRLVATDPAAAEAETRRPHPSRVDRSESRYGQTQRSGSAGVTSGEGRASCRSEAAPAPSAVAAPLLSGEQLSFWTAAAA
jgi:hypothetical protein